ncbi:hypothetical protein SAMN02745196_00907 [Clostridium collagenovorans DSM 3089]|uniref:Cof subfamily of IIB subfamily of haloacid dehalogenase superfamily/HAD-superfamily hydrolase, subfamily IIB n=1 Tax=Clostridium collagenovorans DSM 3089 TaxID=1121306 RepID=A0A1M5UAP6_9CLOT|nr:Cof-type HAD-IIB family hydrolase [Clostridium collagenovorans]SHH59763.1 hypothetical protein SAMN02745196_00907 [Clostridium collagenovorans DSM 3089]
MTIKLICIDMDGTLLVDTQKVSEENKKAIKEAINKGVHVAITTGRLYGCAKLYSDSIGLKTPIIASNGAFIGDVNGDTIFENPLSQDNIRDFLRITSKYDLFSYLTTNSNILSFKEVPEDHMYKVLNKSLKKDDQIIFHTLDNINSVYDFHDENILKGVCVEKSDFCKLNKAKEELKSCSSDLEIVSSWNNNFEVMKKGSSKGEAVKQLSKFLNINKEEVMCIGDSENDLSMIQYAGIGVAMGNASDEVKSKAQYVTDTNVNSGVAKAIQKFVLNN